VRSLDLVRQRVEPLRAARDERDVPAVTRDAPRERLTDAARCAGDQRHILCHGAPPKSSPLARPARRRPLTPRARRAITSAAARPQLTPAEFADAVATLAEHHGVERLRDKLARLGAFTSRRGLNTAAAIAERLHLLTGGLRRQVAATYAFSHLWTEMIS